MHLENRMCFSVKEVIKLGVLSVSHILFLPWRHLPTDLQDCNGAPGLSNSSNLVMEDVEGRATSDVPLRFWKRYKKCSTSNLKSA